MAVALIDQFTAASDAGFISKVTISMQRAALQVASEACSTSNHSNRVDLARAVLLNHSQYATQFAWACAAQGVDNSSTDTQINIAVDSSWSAIAGVP